MSAIVGSTRCIKKLEQESRNDTYADFILDGTLGADSKVLAGNGRVRADDDAVYVDNLVASSTASPLPTMPRGRLQSQWLGLGVVALGFSC